VCQAFGLAALNQIFYQSNNLLFIFDIKSRQHQKVISAEGEKQKW